MREIKVHPAKVCEKLTYIQSLLTKDVFIAGGAIRSIFDKTTIDDYDLFFRGPSFEISKFEEMKQNLLNNGFEVKFTCPEGKLITLKKEGFKVQLINKQATAEVADIELLFDLNATMFAYVEGKYYSETKYIKAAVRKKLEIVNLKVPYSTMRRMFKYEKKGYNIRKAIEQFCEHLAGPNITNYDLVFYID